MADLFLVPRPENERETPQQQLPPDHAARESALDVEHSWIVEAPAGSGKTGLLIQRFLKLLAHESVEKPEQVLAITFTVKAATEIRERVLEQLENAANGAPLKSESGFVHETRSLALAVLARDRNYAWGLLEYPRRLRVQTIDSICAEIARSLPVLSGGGGQSPVEDATHLYREAAQQTLMQLGGTNPVLNDSLRTVLLHRDGNLNECESLIAEMLQWRDQWGELVPLGRELSDDYLEDVVLPKLQRSLEEAIHAGLTALADAMPQSFLNALCSMASSLAEIEPHDREHSPLAACIGNAGVPSCDAADLQHWRALIHLLVTPSKGTWRKSFAKNTLGFETTPKQKQQLKALLDEVADRDDLLHAIQRVNNLPPDIYPQEQWVVAKALFHVLNRAMAELQLVFAQRGECDFTQLGLLARSALRREGAVDDLNETLGMKLQHLLVDEMQDTSTGQYELLHLLTQSWDGSSQTVFLVGDPKQSIYLFRQARVERFVQTMEEERLGDLPLQALQLTANFRSQRELVEAFNEDFELLFPRTVSAANPEEVAYVRAEAVNGPTQYDARGLVWHAHVLRRDDAKREKRRQARREAQQVCEIVQQWRTRSLPEGRRAPWKIAVLVRTRTHLAHIVSSLKEISVPFRAVDIEPLKERQEVLDLLALTRALLHPADRVAWLAVLRAPWCGLELAELHLLTGADDPDYAERSMQDVIAERGDLLREESCARLMRVWPILQAAVQSHGRLTMVQRIERTWRSLGGDAVLTDDQMANARSYLHLLDEVERESGPLDLGLLERKISRLYAESSTSEDSVTVDLMTIHGAKGLEWDVVIVPGLEKKARGTRERLLNWNEIVSKDDDAAHVVLAPIASKGEPSLALNAWLRGIDKARDAAERKRLFYVACTRAREELHLFASPQENSKGEINPAKGTLLDTAWPAAQRHFANIAATPHTQAIEMEPQDSQEDGLAIAATEDAEETLQERVRAPKLQRLPLEFDPTARFKTSEQRFQPEAEDAAPRRFSRPEGSFEARSLGNAVHVFLEMAAKRMADGVGRDALLEETATWQPRIAAVLRADGLAPHRVEKLASQVEAALRNALSDDTGIWLLGAQTDAVSEYALTAWDENRSSVRLDRVFRAGATPHATGDDYLWIIDYKTATHGREGLEEFLEQERTRYAPQMNLYAEIMRNTAESGKLRIGLYYPMLSRLVWWKPEETSSPLTS